MAYFSSKSTWLSLVDGHEAASGETPIPFLDYRPGGAAAASFEDREGGEEPDLEQLRQTRALRHRLFFQHQEWEFGPALLEDLFKLARAEANAEEALAWYCQARHVAKTLVEVCGHTEILPAWLEADRVIAELHHLMGNFDSCAVYAREGLATIKLNKFDPELDMRITRLAVRFFQLLGRH